MRVLDSCTPRHQLQRPRLGSHIFLTFTYIQYSTYTLPPMLYHIIPPSFTPAFAPLPPHPMWNLVPFARSYPTTPTPSIPSRRRPETTIYISKQQPQLPSPSPLSSSESVSCSLTSSISSHTRRLVKHFRRMTSSRVRLADVEEGVVPYNIDVQQQQQQQGVIPAPMAQVSSQVSSAPSPSGSGFAQRRALLIGIAYHGELLNTHQDVDRYRDVLIATYGYRPEDITVLKDDPAFADHLQPTRENILREMRSLVAGAAAGDRFTFLFSGHSNQQPSSDLNKEDFLDDYLITIDDEVIIDNELNDVLVKPLPTGCSLFALLDACHSGTLLDLPHYYCNSVYVPWCSKGKRRTNMWQNVTVRKNAAFIQDPFFQNSPLRPTPTISSILAQTKSPERMRPMLPIFVSIPLSINTDRRVASAPKEIGARRLRDSTLPSPPLFCTSPQSRLPCNGWCMHEPNTGVPTVISLSACLDNQRTWEAYDGSLTTIVCSFLEQNRRPSYKDLMTHVNFKLHATARQLHDWTRSEKMRLKEQATETAEEEQADPSSRELDNFQMPLLSSLVPLLTC
ncbi:caspase domain-containing protein [Russula compacta]|nr:caspase domain-containing protein [Russula compacta]